MALGVSLSDRIGPRAIFGGFVMGAAMPRGVVGRDLLARIQPLLMERLLPLFFPDARLNPRIGRLDTRFLWVVCAAVLAFAVLGKRVACWLATRATGSRTARPKGSAC